MDPLTSILLSMLTSGLVSGLLIGLGIGYHSFHNPVVDELKRARKKDHVLAVIFRKNGSAEIRALKQEGSTLQYHHKSLLRRGGEDKRVWELKRMQITRKMPNGTVVLEVGSDRPAILQVGKMRVPIMVLHEDNASAPSNPSLIAIDPDALIGRISAKDLYMIKSYAELMGMLRERSKLRDALYYFFIMFGIGLMIYLIISAMQGLGG